MPLLRRVPFVPNTALPDGLSPGEQVFVVRVTGEVFRDYECVPAWRLHTVVVR